MRKLVMDVPNILLATLAGLTCYLILGFRNGFHTTDFEKLFFCAFMGFLGGIIPTLWEIFTSSRDLARLSHSWLLVVALLAVLHVSENPTVDALCFGYLFHLFVDAQNHKLAPVVQLKSANRKLWYGLIVLVYLVLILYALYARAHPPVAMGPG